MINSSLEYVKMIKSELILVNNLLDSHNSVQANKRIPKIDIELIC